MSAGIIDPTKGARREVESRGSKVSMATSLRGMRVGLLDNKKRHAADILDAVGKSLESLDEEITLVRLTKHDFAMPLPDALVKEIQEACDVVVIGVGDCGSCSASAVADGINLESRGIASAVICTDAFSVTSQAMAKLEGQPDFQFLLTAHPIANLTADDIAARADELAARVHDRLTSASLLGALA
jgi:hypothetical protein